MNFQTYLLAVGPSQERACEEAREWAGERTAEQAWDECSRANWLLWWVLAEHPHLRPQVIRIICRLWRERTAQYVPTGELRPLRAIEAAEAWAENDTAETRAAAGAAAWAAKAAWAAAWAAAGDAAEAAAWAAAGAAAWAAAGAAWAARTAAGAAWAARTAAWAAGDAAEAAAWAAAGAAGWAAENRIWCEAIRAAFPCPWQEP
jgi:hypothetical protein